MSSGRLVKSNLLVLESELTIVRMLGGGAFGKVEEGRLRGSRVAIKTPYFDKRKHGSRYATEADMRAWWKKQVMSYTDELNLMAGLNHPNICMVMGATEPDLSSAEPKLRLVMELLQGDLEDIILGKEAKDPQDRKKLHAEFIRKHPKEKPPLIWRFPPIGAYKKIPLFERLDWAYQAAQGVQWLHEMKNRHGNPRPVIHRDLKMANLLVGGQYGVSDLTIKVGDFGLSQLRPRPGDNNRDQGHGTMYYLGPEVLRGERDTYSDIYTFGLLLWEFVERKDIYSKYGVQDLKQRVLERGEREKLPSVKSLLVQAGYCPDHAPGKSAQWPKEMQQLIADCWAQDPKKRPAAKEVVKRLESILQQIAIADDFARKFWRENYAGDLTVSNEGNCRTFVQKFLNFAGCSSPVNEKFFSAIVVEKHNEKVSVIRMDTFGKVISAFGPLRNRHGHTDEFFQRLRSALVSNYFHGILSTTSAEKSLHTQPRGVNLVRLSNTRYGCFVLSRVYKHKNGGTRIAHKLIHHDPDNSLPFCYDTKPERYDSLRAVFNACQTMMNLAEDSHEKCPSPFKWLATDEPHVDEEECGVDGYGDDDPEEFDDDSALNAAASSSSAASSSASASSATVDSSSLDMAGPQ